MKPTHLTDRQQPAIWFRPAISVTGLMLQATILRLIHEGAKKIDEAAVNARLGTLLQAEGASCTQHLDGPYPEEIALAQAYAITMFPGFFPDQGEDHMSRYAAQVANHKPRKATGGTEAQPKKEKPASATTEGKRRTKKAAGLEIKGDGSAPGPMAGVGND